MEANGKEEPVRCRAAVKDGKEHWQQKKTAGSENKEGRRNNQAAEENSYIK